MAKISTQNYSYANNSSGELINISTAQRNEKYFCPICGELMNPHMGKVRRWHFVHKNIGNCTYESYLHKLAKIKIREAFLSSEHFLLSYKSKAICSYDCPFVGFPKCEGEKLVEFDLRRYYDTCEIEAPYHQYRADLLLSSSVNSKLPPVLIEIMVTHKCTEDKIKDGVRIIEIPIQSEEQIDDIVKNCKLIAVRDNQFNNIYQDESNIILYNFNKVVPSDHIGRFNDIEICFNRINTIVFWLNSQGQFGEFGCRCYEVSTKVSSNVHYFISEIATPFKEIFQGFSKRGVRIRNCFLCKFSKQKSWGERLCVLYKKHNLPRKPSPYSAVTCPHYREDFGYSQNMESTVQPLSADQTESFQGYKYNYHICKDIL